MILALNVSYTAKIFYHAEKRQRAKININLALCLQSRSGTVRAAFYFRPALISSVKPSYGASAIMVSSFTPA